MIEFGKIARAALAAALVTSCSNSGNGTTGTSSDPVCQGDALAFWAGEGQGEVTAADLQKLAEVPACAEIAPVDTAANLGAYLLAAQAQNADPKQVLCAGWFAFVLNERHGRFACDGSDVLFDMGTDDLSCDDIESAVRTALAIGDGDALRAFFAEANGGMNVCVCSEPTGATGGTGGTGGSGSWGM